MRKFWAILSVVGIAAFWIYGFIALWGVLGDRPTHAMTFVLCLAGLAAGLVGWKQVMRTAPSMHRRRAAARARLEEEFVQSTG